MIKNPIENEVVKLKIKLRYLLNNSDRFNLQSAKRAIPHINEVIKILERLK